MKPSWFIFICFALFIHLQNGELTFINSSTMSLCDSYIDSRTHYI